MHTIIYLSGQDMKIVVGREHGKKLMIESVEKEKIPENCMRDGQVADEAAFTEYLEAFRGRHCLPGRNVTLVLGSSCGMVKLLRLPEMSHRNMMGYLHHEFAAAAFTRYPVYTYKILGKEDGRVRALASVLDRDMLEQRLCCMKHAGISVRSVAIDLISTIILLEELSCIQGKNCVAQMLEGRDLITILFVRGTYFHFAKRKISEEPGTLVFGMEAARAVSSMKLFLQTQYHQEEITHVYLGDGFEPENQNACRLALKQMDESLKVEPLYPKAETLTIQLSGSVDRDKFGSYFTGISGLMMSGDGRNLIRQIRKNTAFARRCRALLRGFAPSVAVAAALLFAAGLQGVITSRLLDKITRQMNVLGDLTTMEKSVTYDRLENENEVLTAQADAVSRSLENICGYPVYTSDVRKAIEACCEDGLDVTIEAYDGVTGDVQVDVEAREVMDISAFVNRLECETHLFGKIGYDGFSYDERGGIWRASIHCYLNAREVKP